MSRALTPRHREIVLMRCRDGMTTFAIGQRLGTTDQTVRNQCAEILKRCEAHTFNVVCWRAGLACGKRQLGEVET